MPEDSEKSSGSHARPESPPEPDSAVDGQPQPQKSVAVNRLAVSLLNLLDEQSPSGRQSRHSSTTSDPELRSSAEHDLTDRQNPDSARYQIYGEIARGGMGCILKGQDTNLGREIALKVLLSTYQDRPELVQRFLAEAQIAGQLQHPGIVPVYEVGQLPDQRPYFTMKLVKGQTLARLLAGRSDPSVDLSRMLSIFEQVCQTLAYAHTRGVVHRDLKPANIMVGKFGEVQVMDWGLAKVLDRAGQSIDLQAAGITISIIRTSRSGDGKTPGDGAATLAGSVLGTPAYMSPEQALGQQDCVDSRSDVFGLGAILCEILTGQPPYVAPDDAAVLRMARQADLDDALSRLDACEFDRALVSLTRRCLAAVPSDRPADAEVVADEVERYRETVSDRLRQSELERARMETTIAQEKQLLIERQKRRRITLLFSITTLLITAFALRAWFDAPDDSRNPPVRASVNVTGMVTAAEALYEQAMSRLRDHEIWSAVQNQVRTVQAMTGQEGAAVGMSSRVHALVRGVAEADSVRTFLGEAESARQMSEYRLADAAPKDVEKIARRFRAALQQLKLDPGAVTAEHASMVIRAMDQRLQLPLVETLDDWLLRIPSAPGTAAGRDRGWIRDVLTHADPDAWRQAVRDAGSEPDPAVRTAKLLQLAARVSVEREFVSTMLNLALQLLETDSSAGMKLLRQCRIQHPAEIRVNLLLGQALTRDLPNADRPSYDQQLEEGLQCLQTAAALQPQDYEVRIAVGTCLMRLDRLDEAEAAFRQLLVLDPARYEAPVGIGHIHRICSRLPEAVEAYVRAVELATTPESQAESWMALMSLLMLRF